MGLMPHNPDTLFRYCQHSKDHYVGRGAEACYCTQYGIIIASKKKNCKGFKRLGAQDRDRNDA